MLKRSTCKGDVQAAMGAGQKEAASEALSRWLESLSGRPDAAVDLGSGWAAPASETEAALQVCRPSSRCGTNFCHGGQGYTRPSFKCAARSAVQGSRDSYVWAALALYLRCAWPADLQTLTCPLQFGLSQLLFILQRFEAHNTLDVRTLLVICRGG